MSIPNPEKGPAQGGPKPLVGELQVVRQRSSNVMLSVACDINETGQVTHSDVQAWA